MKLHGTEFDDDPLTKLTAFSFRCAINVETKPCTPSILFLANAICLHSSFGRADPDGVVVAVRVWLGVNVYSERNAVCCPPATTRRVRCEFGGLTSVGSHRLDLGLLFNAVKILLGAPLENGTTPLIGLIFVVLIQFRTDQTTEPSDAKRLLPFMASGECQRQALGAGIGIRHCTGKMFSDVDSNEKCHLY